MKDKILVIDDDEIVHIVFTDFFEGVDVLHAYDSEVGLIAYENNKESICLVIVDYTLPTRNGVQLIKELVRNNPFRKFKIVLFSSTYNENDFTVKGFYVEGLIDLFVTKHNPKPCDIIKEWYLPY